MDALGRAIDFPNWENGHLKGSAWWFTLVIQTPGQRQKDQYDFEVGLVYTVSSRLTQMAGPYSVSERGWKGWAEQSSGFSLLGSNASWSSSVYEFAAIGTLCHSGSRCRNTTPRRFLQGIGLCGCRAGEAHLNLQSSCRKSPELEAGISDGISEQSWFCS